MTTTMKAMTVGGPTREQRLAIEAERFAALAARHDAEAERYAALAEEWAGVRGIARKCQTAAAAHAKAAEAFRANATRKHDVRKWALDQGHGANRLIARETDPRNG